MAQVDSDDDDIERFVVHHYRFDPSRNERRNVVAAAFDNAQEFEAFIHELGASLRDRKARGEAEPDEHISGVISPAGSAQHAQEERWASKARLAKHRAGRSRPPFP